MPKIAATSESEAPAPARPITAGHRVSAAARGFSVDATVAALRQSLTEAHHALSAIIGAAPGEDENLSALRSLDRRLLMFAGEVDLLAGFIK
jgi:outer membrane protein TolC